MYWYDVCYYISAIESTLNHLHINYLIYYIHYSFCTASLSSFLTVKKKNHLFLKKNKKKKTIIKILFKLLNISKEEKKNLNIL